MLTRSQAKCFGLIRPGRNNLATTKDCSNYSVPILPFRMSCLRPFTDPNCFPFTDPSAPDASKDEALYQSSTHISKQIDSMGISVVFEATWLQAPVLFKLRKGSISSLPFTVNRLETAGVPFAVKLP
jgi:hypothetical protein